MLTWQYATRCPASRSPPDLVAGRLQHLGSLIQPIGRDKDEVAVVARNHPDRKSAGRQRRHDCAQHPGRRARRGAHHPGAGTVTIRVVIADDHRVVRDGLCYLLSQEPDIDIVGEAGDGRQTVHVVAATRPDVLLLDLYMPGLGGHAVLAALHDEPHRPAVVVLTSATGDEHLVRAMHAGATSYLLKTAPAEHVIAAIRDAAAGTASLSPELLTQLTRALRQPPPPDPLQPLSPRERDVLRLIACGHSNRQIARDLVIGEQTVKTHVRSILTKLGLQDRVQAAIFALRHQADSGEHRP
jgi:NarL family two-component system response regulator LiaR